MKGSIVPIKPEVVVKVIECGPLRIGGHVRIMFSDGSMVIKQRAFICRCGKSSNSPLPQSKAFLPTGVSTVPISTIYT